jgi:2-haloacid dehalogenase
MAGRQIDSIVFDLGNVLIPWDARNLYRKLFPGDEAGMERFLATVCTPEWNDTLDSDVTFAQGTADLIKKFPAQKSLIRAYDKRWEEMLGAPIIDNVELLKVLADANWPLYALSNWSKEKFPIARAKYGFLGLFKDMVISGEVGIRKPNPAIFRLLLERHQLEPAKTLFIDDTAAHIEAARALGFMAIRHISPAQLRTELDNLGIVTP